MRDHLLVGPVLFVGIAALSLLGGCSDRTPSGPDLEAAGGGESDPVVTSAEPRLVPPNATLGLRVFGSGFDDESRVDVAVDGVPSPKVRTDSTRFVSEGEVVATITTATDVPLGFYDIVLTDRKGKQGIGTELIDVDSTSGIQVVTSTTGTDQPVGGYDIVIDGKPAGGHRVSPTGSAAVTGLSEGEHSVGLEGVPENCAVGGDNPRAVSVPRNSIVAISFGIQCPPSPPPPAPPPPAPPSPPSPPPMTGDVLAFVGGDLDIYWMTPEGLGPVNLTNSTATDSDPDWSPDGSQIAFTSSSAGGSSQIYIMRADGSGVSQLTRDVARWASLPQWSPDGSQIAFVGGDILGTTSEISVMRADGSQVRQLTTAWVPVLKWSPDGSKIAFTDMWEWRLHDLYVMNSDGTGKRALKTQGETSSGGVAWSPDGSRIAYDAWNCCRPSRQISIVQSDGSGRVLMSDENHDSFDPAWSPDGSKIAFTQSHGPADFANDIGIFVISVNGAGLRRLPMDVGFANNPVWSPDGSRIAFRWPYPLSDNIAIVNSDGTGLRTLVPGYSAAWRPRHP